MASSTVENYLKRLYLEQQKTDGLVSLGHLAQTMGVVPGTVTSMVKALSSSGLVEYEPRGGVRLTRGGEQLALHVLRRHRLVELFLVEVLGLDWSEVHEEAETLEHVISDRVLDRIDALLRHPQVDPHGDPIPTAKGKLPEVPLERLADCRNGQRARVARIVNQDSAFLQFAEKAGLVPGSQVQIEKIDSVAQSVSVRTTGRNAVSLGLQAAGQILVQPDAPGR